METRKFVIAPLKKKIVNNILIIIHEWNQDIRFFSVELAVTRIASNIMRCIRLNTISNKLLDKKNEIVLAYLKKEYGYIFVDDTKKINVDTKVIKESTVQPVWVCWLDGVENAPLLVKECIKSIYQHANGHPIHLITWVTLEKYIEIPEYIINRVKNNEMKLAHFADVIRILLLEKYGGLWLDATIYCSQDIPHEYFEYSFFTCKDERMTPGCVSNNRWTTFCIGGEKGNLLFKVLKQFYLAYWEKESCAIDYLFFDDAIEIAYEMLPQVKKEIDNVPINNQKRDELILQFANKWDYKQVEHILESDTVLFKLGYREEFFLQECDAKGNKTVYKFFIDGGFGE